MIEKSIANHINLRIEHSTYQPQITKKEETKDNSFRDLLDAKINDEKSLRFSKHAQERAIDRGIDISTGLLKDLQQAVLKAKEKGAKDIVIIDKTSAFIVNVKNNMVITTVSQKEMQDNIFTNIDSAVIL